MGHAIVAREGRVTLVSREGHASYQGRSRYSCQGEAGGAQPTEIMDLRNKKLIKTKKNV